MFKLSKQKILHFSLRVLQSFLILWNLRLLLLFISRSWKFSDFGPYYMGGLILRKLGPSFLYNIHVQEAYQLFILDGVSRGFLLAFKGSPLTALLYLPFTFLSPYLSYFFFLTLNLLVLWLILLLLAHFLRLDLRSLLWTTLSFSPVYSVLVHGQPSLILFLVFLGVFILNNKGKYFWAGVLFSLVSLKIQYSILFLPLFLILNSGRRQFALGFFGGSFLQLIFIFSARPLLPLEYIQFLFATEGVSYGSWPSIMHSVQYLLFHVFPTTFSLVLSALLYLVFCLILCKIKNLVASERFLYGVAFLIFPLFAYHVISQDLVLLLLGAFLLYSSFADVGMNALKLYLQYAIALFSSLVFCMRHSAILNNFTPLLVFATVAFLVRLYMHSSNSIR